LDKKNNAKPGGDEKSNLRSDAQDWYEKGGLGSPIAHNTRRKEV